MYASICVMPCPNMQSTSHVNVYVALCFVLAFSFGECAPAISRDSRKCALYAFIVCQVHCITHAHIYGHACVFYIYDIYVYAMMRWRNTSACDAMFFSPILDTHTKTHWSRLWCEWRDEYVAESYNTHRARSTWNEIFKQILWILLAPPTETCTMWHIFNTLYTAMWCRLYISLVASKYEITNKTFKIRNCTQEEDEFMQWACEYWICVCGTRILVYSCLYRKLT